MHPIEHLRYVARAGGADPALVARETAEALVQIARAQPAGLLPACRRMIDHHPTSGPVWWLSARMLRSDRPASAGQESALELEEDETPAHLEGLLPDEATVLAVGWPDQAGVPLRRRGDVEVLVVEWESEGGQFAARLRDADNEARLVPESGAATAAVVADVVILDVLAAGPTGVLAVPGSLAAALSAHHQQIPVWAVAGVGRVLPAELWDALLARLDEMGAEPWDRPVEVVPADLVDVVVGPEGERDPASALATASCPVAPELLRPAG